VRVTSPPGSTLSSTATVNAATADPKMSNNSATVVVAVGRDREQDDDDDRDRDFLLHRLGAKLKKPTSHASVVVRSPAAASATSSTIHAADIRRNSADDLRGSR
jgi:hypothetical protein